VLASRYWEYPRVKELNELKKRMRGRQASRDDAALFDLLTERFRPHWLDPRLVENWTYQLDATGSRRLLCEVGLPEGVKVEVPPPMEKRIAIGGKYLDDVRIAQSKNMFVSFPVDRHKGTISEDGTVTVHAMMPTALQLLAEGVLPAVGTRAVNVTVAGRELGPVVLAEVCCGGESLRNDVAILVFKPMSNDMTL